MRDFSYSPRLTGENLSMWEQTHNILDGKLWRLSAQAYTRANQYPNGTWRKKHVPYTLCDEAQDLLDLLKELSPDTSRERCEEMVAFAISPAVNQKIFGRT